MVISLGNGKSTNKNNCKVRVLKQKHCANGYRSVKLFKDGKHSHLLVHRIVAKTFIPNPDNKRYVNHIDGNKANNNVNNLEWCTASENLKHAFKTGLSKPIKGADNKQSKKIKQIQVFTGKVVKVWDSLGEIKRELGFNKAGIIGCCKNKPKYKTAYNYKWEYVYTNNSN